MLLNFGMFMVSKSDDPRSNASKEAMDAQFHREAFRFDLERRIAWGHIHGPSGFIFASCEKGRHIIVLSKGTVSCSTFSKGYRARVCQYCHMGTSRVLAASVVEHRRIRGPFFGLRNAHREGGIVHRQRSKCVPQAA